MFTGLIDDIGTIERVARTDAGLELAVRCSYDHLAEGESIAVNGVCLTVRAARSRWFGTAAVSTTVDRTAVGGWSTGRRLNLERAMPATGRLGGHLVQGHVDGVASVLEVSTHGNARLLDLALPVGLSDLMVLHGAVAVDGVSLTVNDLPAPDVLQVALVEYTLRRSTLGDLRAGDHVHIEADIIGKYVQRLLAPYSTRAAHDSPR